MPPPPTELICLLSFVVWGHSLYRVLNLSSDSDAGIWSTRWSSYSYSGWNITLPYTLGFKPHPPKNILFLHSHINPAPWKYFLHANTPTLQGFCTTKPPKVHGHHLQGSLQYNEQFRVHFAQAQPVSHLGVMFTGPLPWLTQNQPKLVIFHNAAPPR